MKNYRKSRKALSPVVASIILIAVTVAVSIAVAAWMGALTTGFMATEELKITNVAFAAPDAQAKCANATIFLRNTGSTAVTVTEIYCGNELVWEDTVQIAAGTTTNIDIDTASDPITYDAGTAYQFKVMSSKGNVFVYTATAPTS